MRHCKAILIILVCFLTQEIFCQEYRFSHWGIEDGLSQGINQKIIRDSKGFLWITSYEGVNRFDGKSFRNFYSFPPNKAAIHGIETTGIIEDSRGKIWIGSGDGLNRYDPVTDAVSVFFPEGKANTHNYIIPVAATKQEVISFDITGTISAFNAVTLKRRVVAKNIPWHNDYVTATNCWLDSTTNTLWMPAENGIVKIDLTTNKVAFYFKGDKINALQYQAQKKILLFGLDDGYMEWDMKTGTNRKITTLQSVDIGKVTCITIDKQHTIWIGSEQHGLFTIAADNTVTNFIKTNSSGNSISGNKINSIYCDTTGIVWTGVATNGIDQLTPGNRFEHFSENVQTKNNLNNNIVRCFFEDAHQKIWIATQGGGINIFDPLRKTFSAHTTQNTSGLPFDFIRYMVADETNAWIGTEKGLCRMNTQTMKTEKISFNRLNGEQLPDLYIEHIIPFTDSSWLIATKTYGLFELFKKSNRAVQVGLLGDKHIFYIAFVNELLFVSYWDGEEKIFEIKNGNWQEIKREVSSYLITYVLYDSPNHTYWIGTLKGLLKADDSLHVLHQYTTEDGLSNNYVYALLKDDHGLLWISTNKGLSRFNSANGSFNIYTPSDGLQGYEYNAKACLKTGAGVMYFGGTDGFDMIRSTSVPSPSEKPGFYIKSLLVNNVLLNETKDINYTDTIHFTYGQNNITIQAGTIDFIAKEKSKIRYKLEPADATWRMADRDFVINYSGLAPGNYTFTATAADSNNEWSSNYTVLHILIAKPWWQTWWFRILSLTAVAALLFFIIRAFYTGKLKQQKLQLEKKQLLEKERTRIATDMHDDLGAGLSRIRFLSENIDMKQQLQQPIEEDIDKIKTYSHEMIDKMGEIVWALNEKNDSLQDLVAYVRSYTMEYLSQNNINCKADIADSIPSLFVSGEFRRNIFLAVKEALHNIVKHAKATEVIFQISLSNDIQIIIHDNGIGFDLKKINVFRNGINNINSRMEAINGIVVIKHQHGTRVQLTAPIPI